MDSRDLKSWQLDRLHRALSKMLWYVTRLLARMDQRGFPPTDPLYQFVRRLRDDLHAVVTHLHYAACERRKWERERAK